ncbi:3-octaprenyl-4-hydroxybenzoate carboxy-lyase, partial [Vibrio cyclitrophicus]
DITKKWDAELALSPDVESAPVSSEHIEGSLAELTKAHPEIIDIHLQNDNASMVVVSIDKQAAGNGKKIMEAVWSQFDENKFVIVCDGDVNVSDWNDIIWAVTTRMDPARDTLFLQNETGHSKMGLDATNKWEGECLREWGVPITKDPELVKKIDSIWEQLGIS